MALEHTIRTHNFTQGLTGAQVSTLAAIAREVAFEENQVILADGQLSASFYLLVEGSAVVELRASTYSTCVQTLSPGDVFGWSSLLDRQDTLFQVRARERTTAVEIRGDALKSVCAQDPTLAAALYHRVLYVVAGRVKATETRYAEMCGIRV